MDIKTLLILVCCLGVVGCFTPIEDTLEISGRAGVEGQEEGSGGIRVDLLTRNKLVGGGPEVQVASTNTDEQGRFAFEASRIDYTLRFSSTGFVDQRVEVVFDPEDARFEIADAGDEIAPGEPLATFRVVLLADRSARVSGQLISPVVGVDWGRDASVRLSGTEVRSAQVNGEGVFEASDLRPGLYTLEIEVEGHQLRRDVISLEGGAADLGPLGLVPLSATLSGSLRLDGESSHEDAVVRVRRNEVQVATTLTDALGAFAVSLTPDTYRVAISRTDFIPQELLVTFDQGRFVVDDEPLDEVEITLLRAPQSDRDADNTIDTLDNCPEVFNQDQADLDGDGIGDPCDNDKDNDGVVNGLDNCPLSPNPMQEDPDGDGLGVTCSGFDADAPLFVGCQVSGQHLDTRSRPDKLRGSCGGAGAPEVVYRVFMEAGDVLNVRVEAEFGTALYIRQVGTDEEALCSISAELAFTSAESGLFDLVVDGQVGAGSSGKLAIDIQKASCLKVLEHTGTFEVGNGSTNRMVLGDINGDGLVDAFVTSRGSNDNDDLRLIPGVSGGLFGDPARQGCGDIFCSLNEPIAPVLGDLDGDGDLDAVYASETNNGKLGIMLNTGEGSLEPGEDVLVGDSPRGVALADFNGDGVLDLAVHHRNERALWVMMGEGDGRFGPETAYDAGSLGRDVVSGDLDLDGWQDIVVSNQFDNTLGVYMNRGDGRFLPVRTLGVGINPHEIALGDLNKDGLPDIVVANSESGDVSVLLGLGSGDFVPFRRLPIGFGTHDVELGDVNGDGLVDLVATLDEDNLVQGAVAVCPGDGRGGVLRCEALQVNDAEPFDLALADLNADGADDLVSLSPNNDTLNVWHTTARASFNDKRTIATTPLPKGAVSVDINGDGTLEIVSIGGHEIRIHKSAQGAFVGALSMQLDAPPALIAEGDLNGDGLGDVVVAFRVNDFVFPNQDLEEGEDSLLVCLGQPQDEGISDFEGAMACTTQTFDGLDRPPQSLVLGHFSDDEHLDAAVVGFFDNTVAILAGGGDGNFSQRSPIVTETKRRQLAVLDLDGDTHPDLVALGGETHETAITVHYNMGPDSERVDFALSDEVNGGVLHGAFGDIDGDEVLDLALCPFNATEITILLGQEGGRGYREGERVAPSLNCTQVALGDLNGDGMLDLIVLHQGQDIMSVFNGDGEGGFGPLRRLPTGRSPTGLLLGDFGEGRLDIVTIDSASDSLTRLISVSAAPTLDGTRLLDAALPTCPPTRLEPTHAEEGRLDWIIEDTEACRIERLEVAVDDPLQGRVIATLHTPEGRSLRLSPSAGQLTRRPENVAELAQLEGHPLHKGQTWTLVGLSGASLVINANPEDPFDPVSRSPSCTPQNLASDVDGVCILDDDLEGVVAPGASIVVIEGPDLGAFGAGDAFEIEVEAPLGDIVSVEAMALRARMPFAEGVEVEAGLWRLSVRVPEHLDGRYLAVVVSLSGDGPYSIRWMRD